jgi:hypothetical protein
MLAWSLDGLKEGFKYPSLWFLMHFGVGFSPSI